eukprot:scaffold6298_cov94-Skeletonema_dohrnii-CCMP3373.AAC.1
MSPLPPPLWSGGRSAAGGSVRVRVSPPSHQLLQQNTCSYVLFTGVVYFSVSLEDKPQAATTYVLGEVPSKSPTDINISSSASVSVSESESQR